MQKLDTNISLQKYAVDDKEKYVYLMLCGWAMVYESPYPPYHFYWEPPFKWGNVFRDTDTAYKYQKHLNNTDNDI